jgi:hypothetical protein
MANILINTANSEYSRVTNYKGQLGIGTPFTPTENGYEISVSRDNLQNKLSKLRSLQQGYRTASIGTLRSSYGGGQGDDAEDYMIDFFKRSLRELLFTTTRPAEVTGNGVYSYFPYRRDFSRIDSARDYIVAVLGDWISLFDSILALTPGLSKLEIQETEATEETGSINRQLTLTIVPESNTRVTVGAVEVEIQTYELPLTNAILSASKNLIELKTLQFFDEDREYKTVLNFGEGNQYLVESWRTVSSDSASVQLKLLKSLDTNIEDYSLGYISRDLANTVVDILNIQLPPEEDLTPFLRPRNLDVGKFSTNKQSINNATLTTLGMLSGSVGVVSASSVSYDDRVFNRWYTSDFNSSELNINFTDYSNFVNFGSAQGRLDAFRQKLITIDSLYGNPSVSSSDAGQRSLAIEIENVKRNFDPYEQFLYFNTSSIAYSASSYYIDDGIEYNISASWPKQQNGLPFGPSSTIGYNWYLTQSLIAQRFDNNNPNYLIKHIPSYLQEDQNSEEFLRFVGMFGHMMDNVKIYVDQLPYIYSTNPDPFEELTMDQVYEVARSFGLDLPNAYSLENLQSFISSNYDGTGTRALVAETWKRFLHSAIYLKKIKGTRNSFDALLNTYGINSPLVQIKESAYPGDDNFIKSDELVYGLRFTSASNNNIRIPFVSSSISASTLQIRFAPDVRQSSSLITGDFSWAIDLIPHPSSSNIVNSYVSGTYFSYDNRDNLKYGRIHVVSGSNRVVIASSSYFPLFSDDYTNIMLRSQSGDISIIQTDGDQILFQESASVNLSSLWNSTQVLHIGGGAVTRSINAVAPRNSWTAGALNTSPAFFANSIDGNAGTRWDTNQFQSAGLIYSVNFNQQLTLLSFIMDTTGSPNDYPGTFSISSSLDGTTWTPINVVSGATITTYNFATPTLASQLRLTIVSPRVTNYWSIHEFNVSASISTSGSIKLGNNFDGIVDEVRLWGENTSTDNLIKQSYDPGSYYGNSYTSSYSNLYVHLAFSQPLASITQSATNESPYVSSSAISTLVATGFTTASYERLLRGIKQYTPIVGSTVYSNNKIHVAAPPIFSSQFINNDGSYTLSRLRSIKNIEEKRYTSGQTNVSFALSPIDFINQNIMRSMGVVNTNYLIGSPRKSTNERYTELDNLLNFYLIYYNKQINPNQYIRFFKDVIKGPNEYADKITPARVNLVDGVVIESPVLDRSKVKLQKSITVDGQNTVIFDNYIAGSGSSNVGAYSFNAEYELRTEVNTTEITNPILQTIGTSVVTGSILSNNGGYATVPGTVDVTSEINVISSTVPSRLPTNKQFLQIIGKSSVSSSLAETRGSSVGFIDSIVDAEPRTQYTSSLYQRNPYLGITGSIASEVNTLGPIYSIEPSVNFNDVGTTTYFYNNTGLYSFNSLTSTPNLRMSSGIEPLINPYKKEFYKAKFNIFGEVASAISQVYANITLISPSRLVDYPGRQSTKISFKTYTANSSYTGVLKISSLISLYRLNGASGLRFRLYSDATVQGNDLSRAFSSPPGEGVLFDALLDGDSAVFPYTIIQNDNYTLFFTVDNITSSNINSEITLNYFEYEPLELIPQGYLPRHYKFNRLNGIAQKRRNYLGCRSVYCPEGCPPDVTEYQTEPNVEIFTSPRTAPVVNRRSTTGVSDVLKIGGKGKLK